MASTYVNNLRLEEITTGEKSGTWGSITNTNLELVGEALGYGTENLGSDANTTITVADGAADAARSFYLKITSTSLSADRTVTLAPNTVSKVWIIENATTGGKAITIKQGTGATIDIPNGDVKVVATDGAGSGGAVYDLLVDLNIATKLTVKNPATSSSPATLLLQSGDTDVAADDVLGKIQFQAPDEGTGTDALLVAGEIAAISEGDFSSSSNATKLSFKTGASEAATEKMSISSVGNVTMKQTATGDDTPMTLLLQTGETDIAANDKLGVINFQAPDEGTGTDAILVAAGIEAVSEGDFSSSSNATKLSFKTASSEAATEKMSLSSGGNLTVSGDLTVTGAAKISHPTQIFRTTSDLVPSSGGSQETLTAWEEVDSRGQANVGSLVSQSSGVFSFSETGIYLINYHLMMAQHTVTYAGGLILATLNNSDYNALVESYSSTTSTSGTYYKNASMTAIFDVTSTTNCKIKLNILASGTTVTFAGNTDTSQTNAVFQKVGET